MTHSPDARSANLTLTRMAETLRQKQSRFARLVGLLIEWLYANGYEATFGETLRTQAEATLNAAQGDGIKNSLHLVKLAIDLNLFRDGKLLKTASAYAPAGAFWKSLGSDCRWGGDFRRADGKPKPDAYHFSIEYQGIK
jgi:hypothetical protein